MDSSSPPFVGTYRTNSGSSDVCPDQAHQARLQRRSDAAFSAGLPSSAPVFTGASVARAMSRAARLGEHGLHAACPVEASAASAHVGGDAFYGSSEAMYERRMSRYVVAASCIRSEPVFSGANLGIYNSRMRRFADCS
jgi:hypothetical protein